MESVRKLDLSSVEHIEHLGVATILDGLSLLQSIVRRDQTALGVADRSTQRARASHLQSRRGSPGAACGRAEQVERVDRGRRRLVRERRLYLPATAAAVNRTRWNCSLSK